MSFICLNGEILPEAEAKIPVTDRAYLFGEGLFESFRSHGGKFPLLPDHLNRLEWSATFLNLPYPGDVDFKGVCGELLAKNGLSDARFKIVLSRTEEAAIVMAKDDQARPQPNVTVFCRPLDAPKPVYRLKTSKIWTNDSLPLAAMKTTSYLVKTLARLEARESGWDDAVLLNAQGLVTEASSGNLFWVDEKGVLKTVPEGQGLLRGVTRLNLFKLFKDKNLAWREEPIRPEELSNMREVFLTNSIVGVQPVSQIDGRKISGGDIGDVTRMIKELWEKRLKEF